MKPKKRTPAISFTADLLYDWQNKAWPLLKPRPNERVRLWLNKHNGGVLRCRYELIKKGQPS